MKPDQMRGPWSAANENHTDRAEATVYLSALIVGTAGLWALAVFGAVKLLQLFLTVM